ncbi:MAG: phosphate ABC transporter permease subunit PstC [Brevinema sp.]
MAKITLDKASNVVTFGCTLCFIGIVFLLVFSLFWHSRESIALSKMSFLTKSTWNTKFLEINRVHLSENSEFFISFSVPILTQNLTDVITISYRDQSIPFDIQQTNNILIISPKILEDGEYTISISSKLKDTNSYTLSQNLTWIGTLVNNTITNPQLIGAKTGLIENTVDNENTRHFMIFPFIVGTLISSLLALFIAFPVALSVSLLITEYSKSYIIKLFTILIDLLAGIPSVIYGLWGLFFLVPRFGANIFTASLVLSIMIMPFAASLSREAISLVPDKLRQAGFGLGASRFKVIRHITLPYARSGIIAGVLLTLGRALGETLAVTMVIGNRNQIPMSLFDPAQTISSLIANEYGEASGLKRGALIESGLVLMIIVLLFSLLGRIIIRNQKTH